MKRILSLALTLTLCLVLTACQKETTPAAAPTTIPTAAEESGAETENDPVVATINGENLLYSDYIGIESAYLYQ